MINFGGVTNSKVDDKREASTLARQETLKGFMSQKDVREEKKRQEKEGQMKTYFDIQKKKFEIEESYAKTKANELKLASISKEVEIMTMDLSKMSPKRRVWFEKKQKDMLDIDG